MREFVCSSDPSSRLNQLRWDLYWLRHLLGVSNRGGTAIRKNYIMGRQNIALADLRHYARSLRNPRYRKPEPECPHFETVVCGIPCGVVVDTYSAPRPWRQHTFRGAGPGDCDPPEPEGMEWHLIDRTGYRAEWLERKMNANDVADLESEIRSNAG